MVTLDDGTMNILSTGGGFVRAGSVAMGLRSYV